MHELLFRPSKLTSRHASPLRGPQHQTLSILRKIFAHRARPQSRHISRPGRWNGNSRPPRVHRTGSPFRGRDARRMLRFCRPSRRGRMRSRILLQRSLHLPRKVAARRLRSSHARPFRDGGTRGRKTRFLFALLVADVARRRHESDACEELRPVRRVTLQHHVQRPLFASADGRDV